jgi:chromosome partitioning protein
VGKTTTTVNLAAALASKGLKVLVIDLDPQGNASTALGVPHQEGVKGIYEVLTEGTPLAKVIQPSTESPNLACIPATIDLAGAEIEIVTQIDRDKWHNLLKNSLEEYLATIEVRPDYVIIDCPPSLGLLTINAFVAAREVLIPIQCEYYALEGLSQLLRNIDLIQKNLNPHLALSTILLTMYDSRTKLASQVVSDVREHFPSQTLNAVIPRNVRISEAPSFGRTVISHDPTSTGAISYMEAAVEIAFRGAQNGR